MILALLLGLAACSPQPAEIGQEELRSHVEYLASDVLAGREPGTTGIGLAECYIAKAFRDSGLSPLPGSDGYFLDFTLYRRGYDAKETALSVEVNGRSLEAGPGIDFRPFAFSAAGGWKAELVFAGYGITAPEYGYDDYEGLSVKGKFVLVLRHEPGEAPDEEEEDFFEGARLTRHSLFTAKAENAHRHGAAGMLLVTDPASGEGPEDLRLGGTLALHPDAPPRSRAGSIPAVHISQPLAAAILKPAGRELDELEEALNRGERPSDYDLEGITVRLRIERLDRALPVPARNVAGFLEGADPELKDEWIVVGAHHDHLGAYRGKGDTVFNGADDNASGVAGVLALARILAGQVTPLKRSLLFVTFTAEEAGLLGSCALIEGQIPLEPLAFMINLDMIGRNPERPVQIMGDGFTPNLRQLVERANKEVGLPLRFGGTRYAELSDHHYFFRQGIPFLSFFTGTHPDYHGTGDHADKLSYSRMTEILKLVHRIILEQAQAEPLPNR